MWLNLSQMRDAQMLPAEEKDKKRRMARSLFVTHTLNSLLCLPIHSDNMAICKQMVTSVEGNKLCLKALLFSHTVSD